MSTTQIILSNCSIVQVPEGADPAAFRKLEEARIRLAANPKKAKPRKSIPRRASGKPRKTFNYATQVLSGYELQTAHRAAATAELVERVNDPVEPDPQGGYLVLINNEPTLWANTPTDARRSYDDYHTSRPIIWRVAGQEIDLEVEL